MEEQVAALVARMDLAEARGLTAQQEHASVHASLLEHRGIIERISSTVTEQGRDLAVLKAARTQLESTMAALDVEHVSDAQVDQPAIAY